MASQAHLEVLLPHQIELELLLKDVDLLKLSKNLLRSKVLSKEASERFASLDPNPEHLEPEVKVRYLLQHVYERVREDDSVCDRLVKVLSKFGGELNTLCGAMRREVVQECTPRGDELEDTELEEQDVSYLVNILVSGSHLWDAIGIALNLPKHKREDCREGKENVNRLSNILTTWILGSYEGARPATLRSLREALASEIVGLGRLARQLMTYKRVDDLVTVVKPQCIRTYITYQSDDIEVSEGKSTLLEVQVSCCENVSYQWSKDGEPLLDGADFSGVCSNILYINRASQCTEGKYSCCVSRGSETVCSDEISPRVIYPPEKRELLEFYSLTEREVPQDSWPPVGNTTFINLVLIEQKPMSTCDYYTIRGDMDDILESKEVAKYEEVFREYKEGALVLVEGRPGSGKTTLCHKLTRDWATGKKVLQGAKMVFLITLRLLNVSGRDKSLLDLLKIYYSETFSEKMEQNLRECKGKEVCFILDGLDEYPLKSKRSLIIDQLLYSKTFLPHSMVIVASRPVATCLLRETCKMRIEVVGFSKDQIYNYVKSYPFDNSSSMQDKMVEYLDQHPNVLHMCYLPVHAAMICFLFIDLEGNIPHRETQIYEQFTIATLLRHKAKVERTQIKSLKDLHGEEEKLFVSVCKLAFDMIINSQQVVNKSDAKVSFSNDSVFGLLTVESASKRYGIEDFYTFHHLTFQEFLAAFHMHEAQCVISELVWVKGFYNVLKFYCGLCESSNIEACKPILLAPNYCDNLFYKAQCAYESQQVELCDYVINDCIIKLHNITISCTDFIALGFVISNTSKPVEKISIQNCWLDSEGVRAFYSVAEKVKLRSIKCLQVYQISTNHPQQEISKQEIETLNCFLKHLPIFEELDLLEVTLSISKIQQLTRAVNQPHLRILKISLYNEFISYPEEILQLLAFGSQNIRKVYFSIERYLMINDDVWRKILQYALGCQEIQKTDTTSWIYLYNSDKFSTFSAAKLSRCTHIILVNCCIGNDEAKMLAHSLDGSLLTNLVLDYNRISDLGAIALAGSLAKCRVLQEFSIQCNSISDSGATALADALVHCSSLRRLDLQGNSLGDEGAVAIAKATNSRSGLSLYLHNINITEEGIEKVLVQRVSTKIRNMILPLSWYSISEKSVDTLRHALSGRNIPQLNLSSTNIMNFENLVVDGLNSVRALEISLKEENVPSLCRIIDSLTTVNCLECYLQDIKSCDILRPLCDCLERHKSINKLHLYNIRDSTILNTIEQQTNLHSLCLSCCHIELTHMVTSFFNSAGSLHSLIFDNCDINAYGAQLLSVGLARCKSLRYLNLSNNYIGDVGVAAVAEALKDHKTLLQLSVEYNCITSFGMRAMIPVIKNNALQCISFAGNYIHSGVGTLVCAMREHSIQYLSFTDTDFGVRVNDIAVFSIRLMMCTQLTTLHLSCNAIKSSGMEILAKGLQHCTNLRILYLDSNGINADGLAAMLPVLKCCKYLQYLGFSDNNIGVDGAAVLVGGWQHKSLLTIDLQKCFDDRHKLALLNVKKCCSECDHLLERYYNNDYVQIKIDRRSIPKLMIL